MKHCDDKQDIPDTYMPMAGRKNLGMGEGTLALAVIQQAFEDLALTRCAKDSPSVLNCKATARAEAIAFLEAPSGALAFWCAVLSSSVGYTIEPEWITAAYRAGLTVDTSNMARKPTRRGMRCQPRIGSVTARRAA